MQANTSHGAATRQAILAAAADAASVAGLDGLTVGRLAAELSMSKSGLFAHFGSKQDLQDLATIEEARQRYVREVIESGPGRRHRHTAAARAVRVIPVLRRARRVPPADDFASAMAEFDAKASGPVRDRIADCQTQWMHTLERAAGSAQAAGELPASSDPQQLAFELEAALFSANWYYHLYKDSAYFQRAARAIRDRLASEATPPARHRCPASNTADQVAGAARP